MTEQEWLECTDPQLMLEFVRNGGKASDRELRLFAVACCGIIRSLLRDDRSLRAIKIAEKYADGPVIEAELAEKRAAAIAVSSGWTSWPEESISLATHASVAATAASPFASAKQTAKFVTTAQQSIVQLYAHDIFGNPFRPITIDPRWLTSTVVDLATAIYDERAFEKMPILADALMDAGCDDEEIIAHCRGSGPHVRGCWVVDLLLGKK